MTIKIPTQPKNSFRVILELNLGASRIDAVLMDALRNQTANLDLKNISRAQFKKLFKEKRILIKDQPARSASSLSPGTTYVDILGYE